ncbi:aromatic prenyltransferase [Saccharomonospora saliphila]|uniref:aromatic prenyltransferase n=1 Tax=Saccharomonospora saliphila TaxID=369829 RepID=UPI0018DDD6CA|nr:aromatic prenyltransferase [Saccharomonospora saliphila]
MSETAELTRLYSALEESAAVLNVPFSGATVQPVLTAYGDVVPHAMIAFRVTSAESDEGELDCRILFRKEVDPYAVALSEGFVPASGHPVDELLSNIRERCPIDSYGIDFGLVGGFKKIWAFFPEDDFQPLSTLVEMPSMPRSLAANVEFFARYGLDDRVGLVGIDYHDRTVNVYFGKLPGECLDPDAVRSMHREIGVAEPSEQMLKLCEQSFGIYFTLNWDSPTIERISFSAITPDPLSLPVRFGPRIERFVENFRHGADNPKMVHAAVKSTGEEYYKIQAYYRWRPRTVNLTSDDSAEVSA